MMTQNLTAYARHPKVGPKDICGRCAGKGRVAPAIRRRNVSDICFACHGSGLTAQAVARLVNSADIYQLGDHVLVQGVECEITAILNYWWPADRAPRTDDPKYLVNFPNYGTVIGIDHLDGKTVGIHQMVPAQ